MEVIDDAERGAIDEGGGDGLAVEEDFCARHKARTIDETVDGGVDGACARDELVDLRALGGGDGEGELLGDLTIGILHPDLVGSSGNAIEGEGHTEVLVVDVGGGLCAALEDGAGGISEVCADKLDGEGGSRFGLCGVDGGEGGGGQAEDLDGCGIGALVVGVEDDNGVIASDEIGGNSDAELGGRDKGGIEEAGADLDLRALDVIGTVDFDDRSRALFDASGENGGNGRRGRSGCEGEDDSVASLVVGVENGDIVAARSKGRKADA